MAKPKSKPRWKCPHCGSTAVQVCYDSWYYERDNFKLRPLWPGEGGVRYWLCENCDTTDCGAPKENK